MIGQNNENIFNINRSLVIQFLQQNKITTRSQLSKALDLTPAAITKIVQELVDHKIIEETGFYAGEKGRRSVGIKLRQDFLFIGARISRRNFSIGVFDFNAIIYDYFEEEFEDESLLTILDRIKVLIKSYIERYGNVVSIGIAVPGPYLENESKIVLVTETKGWDNVNLKSELEGIFTIPLTIMHDANSCALADWWFGSYSFSKNGVLVHMFVGEGVGAGVVINGDIFSGNDGVTGELGHVSIDVNGPKCQCGNYGCLESYCSSIALVKRAQTLLSKYPTSQLHSYNKLTYTDIFKHANEQDELSMFLIKEAGYYIGCGVVNIINMYNPAIIVLGNQMVRDSVIILPEILKVVDERIPSSFRNNVQIVTTAFVDDPTLYGAAAVAMDYCLKNHESLIDR